MEGDLIGTDSSGTISLGNLLNGVIIQSGASDNTVGGTAEEPPTYISGNIDEDYNLSGASYGIEITGSGTSGNVVRGNRIGFDVTSTLAQHDPPPGIEIDGDAADNTIGGLTGAGDDAGFDFATGTSTAETTIGPGASGALGSPSPNRPRRTP